MKKLIVSLDAYHRSYVDGFVYKIEEEWYFVSSIKRISRDWIFTGTDVTEITYEPQEDMSIKYQSDNNQDSKIFVERVISIYAGYWNTVSRVVDNLQSLWCEVVAINRVSRSIWPFGEDVIDILYKKPTIT